MGTSSAAGQVDRTIEVAPDRLAAWLGRFTAVHGQPLAGADGPDLWLDFPDGATVRMVDRWSGPGTADPGEWIGRQQRERRVAILLVRRSAHAVGIAVGPRLDVHHVERHYLQGRTKAGGWSQQRYARRRGNQADQALRAAADDAVRLLLPDARRVEGLVCGGDARAVSTVLADPRLEPLLARRTRHRVIPVPDPRLALLEEVAAGLRAVPVQISDPAPAPQ